VILKAMKNWREWLKQRPKLVLVGSIVLVVGGSSIVKAGAESVGSIIGLIGIAGIVLSIMDMRSKKGKGIKPTVEAVAPVSDNASLKAIIKPSNQAIALSSNFVSVKSNDLWNSIPEDVKTLLFISNANTPHTAPKITLTLDFTNGKINTSREPPDDPSTIYFKAPIAIPAESSIIPRPPYYPSYAELEPEQRYIYLKWLSDISSEIDVGSLS
jgi:hypothetical protein